MVGFGIFWLLGMKTSVRADSDTKEATIRRKARRNRQEKEKKDKLEELDILITETCTSLSVLTS